MDKDTDHGLGDIMKRMKTQSKKENANNEEEDDNEEEGDNEEEDESDDAQLEKVD